MSLKPEDFERLLRTLLGGSVPWWKRPFWWFKDHTEKGLGPNGGYWGGVIMRALGFVRASGARAAAFLRR